MLGAKVVPVESGSKTLKDAINEANRDWVTNITNTHYLVGSAIGPHPFPTLVRDLQSVIGQEAKEQLRDAIGKLPDAAVACVGGGSNAIGLFHPFVEDKSVRVKRYQEGTVAEAVKLMAAMGVSDPSELQPWMLRRNLSQTANASYAELYQWLKPDQLLADPPEDWAAPWAAATADSFRTHH